MKAQQAIILSVCAVILVGLWWWQRDWKPSPEALAKTALSASDLKQRERAAVELSEIRDRAAIPSLRRVVAESKDPVVLSAALTGLAGFNDAESLPLIIGYLNHPEKSVREDAVRTVLRLFGQSLPDDLDYDVDKPPEVREMAVARLKDIYDKGLKAPPPAGPGSK